MSEQDTIFAPATPVGGAIAILRISGARARAALEHLTGKQYEHRVMMHARIMVQGRVADDAMAVYFAAPKSYTGEDMAELYCHGSQAVVRQVSAALVNFGLRPAEAGQFSRRAFLNGKMDLSQAEAVMDLIQADAEQSARAALEQLAGRLRDDVYAIEELLYTALSALSAAIDYPEELEEDVYRALPTQLTEAEQMLSELIMQGLGGRVLREGFRVALVGAPNAGKSSLLNALIGYNRAIVTPQAGTTRDTLEERLLLEGIPVVLTDTAGMRETNDEAEQAGVLRANAALEQADAVLLLLDGSAGIPDDTQELYRRIAAKKHMVLRTKADLPARWEKSAWPDALNISVKTGEGLKELSSRIRGMAGRIEYAYVTNSRHIHALQQAKQALLHAQAAADVDCAAIDIRDALVALGTITGRAVDDEVISEIFARFCVGK